MEVVGARQNVGPSMTPNVNFIQPSNTTTSWNIYISSVTPNLPLQLALCFNYLDDHELKCSYKSWQASQAQMLKYWCTPPRQAGGKMMLDIGLWLEHT
jgi:hypothetical protein